MNIKKSSIVIALVVILSVFVYYRYAQEVWPTTRQEDMLSKEQMEDGESGLKEVSAEVSYTVPGDVVDHLRFVALLYPDGTIAGIRTLDAETGEVPEKKKEFNDQVNVLLKGKKLSELSAIDKVGKSSLTTSAFNQALPKLQSQL